VLIGHINTILLHEEEPKEDKRNNKVQRPHTRQNPKRHISLVSLLLCHKIVAVQCFAWGLGLQMWSDGKAKL